VNSVVELSLLRAPTVGHLPPPNTQRWVVRRKAAVVAAVRSGTITIEEALRRYQLTEEELLSWQRAFEAHGLAGLRATRIQQYRGSRRPRGPRSRRVVIVGLSVQRRQRLPSCRDYRPASTWCRP
jgi:hypothetical protein